MFVTDQVCQSTCTNTICIVYSGSTSSLPQQSATSSPVPGGLNKRYSTVSPVGSPELGPTGMRDSGSSFCVSPIDETDQSTQHDRNDSRASVNAPIPQTDSSDAITPVPEPAQSVPKTVQFAAQKQQNQPVRWDNYSGEPTTNSSGKTSQVNPRNTTFHKSSGSHASNFLHGVREQLQPKKKLAQARNRISSFSKNEAPAQKETRGRSPSRVYTVAEHSGNYAGMRDASPQFSNSAWGFTPTTVTTITAGGPATKLPQRPAAEQADSSQRRVQLEKLEYPEQRDQEEAKFVDTTLENMMRPASRGYTAQPTMKMSGLNDSRTGGPYSSNPGADSTDDLPSIMSR